MISIKIIKTLLNKTPSTCKCIHKCVYANIIMLVKDDVDPRRTKINVNEGLEGVWVRRDRYKLWITSKEDLEDVSK